MPPKILHTDNGAEFKNKLIKSYWEGKGIFFVNGTPGHPQSQGAIEAFNKTVQNFIILADVQRDKFNLEHSIADFFMYYNERKHTTTKHSPIKIISNANNEKLYDDVRENTKYESIIFSKEKKILISNWIKIDANNFCIYSSSKSTINGKSLVKQSWFIKGKVIEE